MPFAGRVVRSRVAAPPRRTTARGANGRLWPRVRPWRALAALLAGVSTAAVASPAADGRPPPAAGRTCRPPELPEADFLVGCGEAADARQARRRARLDVCEQVLGWRDRDHVCTIAGLIFREREHDGRHHVTAVISYRDLEGHYAAKYDGWREEIAQAWERLRAQPASLDKLRALASLRTKIVEARQCRDVIVYARSKIWPDAGPVRKPEPLPVTEEEVLGEHGKVLDKLRRKATTLRRAAQLVVASLPQAVGKRCRDGIAVLPLVRPAGYASRTGRRLADALAGALADAGWRIVQVDPQAVDPAAAATRAKARCLLRGTVRGRTATVRVLDLTGGTQLAVVDTRLPSRPRPRPPAPKPTEAAGYAMQFGVTGLRYGQPRIELLTDRGTHAVHYRPGETMTLSVRLDRPGWVRIVDRMPDGRTVLLADGIEVDEAHVGKVIQVTSAVCDAPFGDDVIVAFASTSPLPPVQAHMSPDGYPIVVDPTRPAPWARQVRSLVTTSRGFRPYAEVTLPVTCAP